MAFSIKDEETHDFVKRLGADDKLAVRTAAEELYDESGLPARA